MLLPMLSWKNRQNEQNNNILVAFQIITQMFLIDVNYQAFAGNIFTAFI